MKNCLRLGTLIKEKSSISLLFIIKLQNFRKELLILDHCACVNIFIVGIGTKNNVESKFLIAIFFLVQVSPLLFLTLVKKVLAVFFGIKNKHPSIDDLNNVTEKKNYMFYFNRNIVQPLLRRRKWGGGT